MSPNNADYNFYIFRLLRNTNATNSLYLPFVQVSVVYCQVSENTIVKDQLPESSAENRFQIRKPPNVFSRDILTKFTKISLQKGENTARSCPIWYFSKTKLDESPSYEHPGVVTDP